MISQLNRAHELHMDLLQPLLPYHMQQRVLIIQFSQRGQATVKVTSCGNSV